MLRLLHHHKDHQYWQYRQMVNQVILDILPSQAYAIHGRVIVRQQVVILVQVHHLERIAH